VKPELLPAPAWGSRRGFCSPRGGLLFGWGTQLSRGCTSGQALSGARCSRGELAFMFAVFGGAYLVATPAEALA
jgi:uncharacterized membrane protein YedE/YeeE